MKKYFILAIIAIVAIVVAFFCFRSCVSNSGVSTDEERRAEMTPAVLDSIHSIGEWQLMSVPLTVEVDTMQKRWLGMVKDKLRRSYTGTMSLGVNLHKLDDEWSSIDNDTITLTIPDICILDSNFIDESQTKVIVSDNSSFEADPKVKGSMLRSAKWLMIRTGVSSENIQKCKQKATDELTQTFETLGYKKVNIVFK